MKHVHKLLIGWIIFTISLSLACNLTGSGSENGGDAGVSTNTDVDVEQLSKEITLPAVRTGGKTYDPDEFSARSLPVEVVMVNSPEPVEVLLKGAIAYPNWNLSAEPPETLDTIFILSYKTSTLLQQNENGIFINYLDPTFTSELLDASGNVLASLERGTESGLFANQPEVYRFYDAEIPTGTTSVRVSVSFEPGTLGVTCFTEADLNFQMPQPVFSHSPVQFELTLDDWAEEYAKESVVADFNLTFSNPYNAEMEPDSTVLFLDEAGSLVGWAEPVFILPANGTYNRLKDEMWQSSYLAGMPAQAQIYEDVDLCDLLEASR